MKPRFKIGDTYRNGNYSLTITNITIKAGYHEDSVAYDIKTSTRDYKSIGEWVICEVIEENNLRLADDIRPVKKIKKLEIR
jgi:hypothetical protein